MVVTINRRNMNVICNGIEDFSIVNVNDKTGNDTYVLIFESNPIHSNCYRAMGVRMEVVLNDLRYFTNFGY